ncbi:MAG TPA: hypothetical protein VF376_02900 [Thermoanaerobaculia bacterium]
MKRLVIAGVLAAAAAVTLSACRERGRPDPNIRMAISHERAEPASAGGSNNPAVPTSLQVPPEVLKAYSGIRLTWKDSSTKKEGIVEVPLGEVVPIPGSGPDLAVRADAYLPAFTMSADVITSTGVEEQNPAARITVLEKGQEIFGGWIFTRFPDVHPFQHPRISLLLAGGVHRKAS